jgi:hypothetical protein
MLNQSKEHTNDLNEKSEGVKEENKGTNNDKQNTR